MIDLAAKLISEGRGMDLMPRKANSDAPITAYRYIMFMIELQNIYIVLRFCWHYW
jgi:hypothetical protein